MCLKLVKCFPQIVGIIWEIMGITLDHRWPALLLSSFTFAPSFLSVPSFSHFLLLATFSFGLAHFQLLHYFTSLCWKFISNLSFLWRQGLWVAKHTNRSETRVVAMEVQNHGCFPKTGRNSTSSHFHLKSKDTQDCSRVKGYRSPQGSHSLNPFPSQFSVSYLSFFIGKVVKEEKGSRKQAYKSD